MGWTVIGSVHILFIATLMGLRFLALPLIGISAFAVLFLVRITDRLSTPRKIISCGIFSILVAAFAASSFAATFFWKDDRSLLASMAGRYPDDPDIHYNLGYSFTTANDLSSAIAEYENALSFDPRHKRARFNLAHAYFMSGQTGKALSGFKALAAQDRSMTHVHQALAVIYDKNGKTREAIDEVKYELSLALSDRVKMLEFLAYLYEKNGQAGKAARITRLFTRSHH
ncbi:MAG: tetratricopeptide repeat protein [Candidatus Omnitrophota bacterium]